MHLKSLAEYCRARGLYCCMAAMLVLVSIMHMVALPGRGIVRIDTNQVQTYAPILPHMRTKPIPGARTYTYSYSLYYANVALQQTGFSLTPASCISAIIVNHQHVDFKPHGCFPVPGSYWNPYEAPINIDLAPYLKNGRNSIQVQTLKPEFNMGPIVMYDPAKLTWWLGMGMILSACIALVLFMEKLTGDRVAGYLLAAAFLVLLNRMTHVGAAQFGMDLPGHLDYIAFIADNWKIPKPFWGWSYYHAPFYYIAGAVVVQVANLFRSFDALGVLQLFNLSCFMTFLTFGVLILHHIIAQKRAFYIAATLLVFYPGGIMFAARIDSNILYYACYAGCLYFALRWMKGNSTQHMGLMMIGFGLALGTRANSLLLFPIIALVVGYHFLLWGWKAGLMRNKYVRVGLLLFCLGFAASAGRTEYYRLTERNDPFLVGNAKSLTHRLLLQEATAKRLFVPNFSMYFGKALWSVWDDGNGRQYFVNSMLKSSMFGEFIWDARQLAKVMSALLMGMVFYIIDGYIVHRGVFRKMPEWWMGVVTLAVPVAALMENRILYPFASSEDFRYIYPSLISFCALSGLVLAQHMAQWRPFRQWLGISLCVSFALCSVMFYYA